MARYFNKNFIFTALFQLFLIGTSCVISYHFTRSYDVIPKAVLHLPDVYVSHSDLWSIVRIFVMTFMLQIIIGLGLYKSSFFDSIKRFANEYLLYLFAYTTASMYLFLATTINYDPQLIAAIGLFSTVLYFLLFIIVRVIKGDPLFATLVASITSMFTRLFSISGVVAIIYFLLPLIMGKAFTEDRDVANVITQVRIFFNPVGDSKWGFKNKLAGMVFEQPVWVTQAKGDEDSLYILERVGKIYKVSQKAGAKKELLLDISVNLGEVEVENGAVGLALHPAFDGNRPFAFLYYTDTRPDGYQLNKLSRFDLSLDSLEARKQSEVTILELIRAEDGFHNGGALAFGPDGFLYLGVGEGVHPPEFKKSSDVFRSGILRLDIDMDETKSSPPSMTFKQGKVANYLVPNDNPFVGNTQILDEYWALGFRNPFRFNFDPQTGDLWLGDVGSTIWEEVNRVEKGKHYQFPMVEGRQDTGKEDEEKLGLEQQGPVYTYEHNAYDRAVIGGVVNRGDLYPELKNQYIFADNYSAKIFAMNLDTPQVDSVELLARANQYAQRGVSSVVQLSSGEILITTLGAASEASGEVLQLVRADQADVFAEEVTDNTPKDYSEESTASMYAVNCSRCHGATGDGKGPDSGLLGMEMPDFTSPMFHFSRSADDLNAVITSGGAPLGMSPMMPPWGGFLKPQEIEHLVIYLQSLPDKHHHH